jgi:hypothetical protein
MTEPTEFQRQLSAEIVKSMTGGWFTGNLAAELRRLEHNNQLLKNALMKACGDDEEMVNEIIESQGELK